MQAIQPIFYSRLFGNLLIGHSNRGVQIRTFHIRRHNFTSRQGWRMIIAFIIIHWHSFSRPSVLVTKQPAYLHTPSRTSLLITKQPAYWQQTSRPSVLITKHPAYLQPPSRPSYIITKHLHTDTHLAAQQALSISTTPHTKTHLADQESALHSWRQQDYLLSFSL